MYDGDITDNSALLQWANDKCVPLVRELTFENAEVTVCHLLILFFNFCVDLFNSLTALMLMFGNGMSL